MIPFSSLTQILCFFGIQLILILTNAVKQIYGLFMQ